MSYRAFKHLLGETSLERKCRFIFGAGILILITASFWYVGSMAERLVYGQNLNTCRMLVGPILLKHHWKVLETQGDFRPVIDSLYDEFGHTLPDDLKYFDWKFIKALPNSEPPADEFERDAIDAFREGEIERTQFVGDSYQFLAAVRLSASCMACHTHPIENEPKPLYTKEGDLFAAVSVSIPLERTNKSVHANRVVLISTAVTTAVLSMIVAYIIVRYVIVKPVKHLKDVSDAVADGNVDVRADIQTRDEFEELCHAFNRMLRNLVAMQVELRGVNRELDRKVDELAQANMALFEMDRLKSDFLTTMTHELRTPLNSIIGFSEVLASNEKLSEKERRYAANIQSSGKMLLGLINDILDLAKIESGKMELHPEEFSVHDVIEGLLTMARPIAEQKSIQIATDVDALVPVVYQDAGKVQQILYNLISNAIKFTPEGGRVTVSAAASNSDLLLAVEDTGVGIAPEDRERIFDKFRQGSAGTRGDSALTRQYTGSGLGLSIVRELCRLLGGDIGLESELGKGSTFTVRLPQRLERSPMVRVPLSDERIDLSKARRVDRHVLASSNVTE
jgi:signal transduction histidine kinase